MTDVSELSPGTMLRGKWRLDRFLGRGGMSSVHAATHRNGMRGAVKILHRELVSNKQVKSRFMREGYVANKVNHPGAVRVLDDDETDDGLVFLVMDLLTGMTLKERWIKADRKLPPDEVEHVLVSVLGVLAAAHAQNIVHRDIKPDNIFLCDDGQVKVLDFGIARLADPQDGAGTTTTTATLGTPAFMSPEQALAHWHRVDGRSDLFALGATAFTSLTGRLIHSGSTLPELLVAAATRQVVPISSLDPDVPPRLAQVIDKSLLFKIEDRWADAAAMLDAIAPADPNDATVLMSEQSAPSTTPEGSSEAPTPRLESSPALSSPALSAPRTDPLAVQQAFAPTMVASDSRPRVDRPVKPTMVSTGAPQRAPVPQTLAAPITPPKTMQMPMVSRPPAPFLPEHLMGPTPPPTAAAVPEQRSSRATAPIAAALAGLAVLAAVAFVLPSLGTSKTEAPSTVATDARPAALPIVTAPSESATATTASAPPAVSNATSASATASNPTPSASAVSSTSAPVKPSKQLRPTLPKQPDRGKCPNGFDEYTGKPCR